MYCLNRLDVPVFMAVPKPMRTEFGISQRLESCAYPIKKYLFAILANQNLFKEKLIELINGHTW